MTDEQIDRVYQDFFRREIPAELPPLRKAERPTKRTAAMSRYVLAASVIALLGLGLLLSNAMQPSKPTVKSSASKLYENSQADGNKILENVEMP